jgi:transposase InsO family protein
MTERRACRLANQPRGTQRYRAIRREDEDALTQAIIELASQYGRYGYRRITALLKRAGWRVGKDRVERISTPTTKTCRRGPRYLASRGAEGSAEAEATWTTVAQRRLVCAAQAHACEPCMELRLRERTDT